MIIDTKKIHELIELNRVFKTNEASVEELERAVKLIEFVNIKLEN